MTYIQSITDRPYTAIPAAGIAARIATPVKARLTTLVRSLISLPSAIGAAFAMAYVDPYQQNRQHKDHSDPQNF